MFNNLIESSSHSREFKRRGSFVLFTSTIYVLFFIVAGVISIYAYDARLEDQNTESIVMLNPVDLPAAPAATVPHNAPPRNNNSSSSVQTFREPPTASINHPELMPPTPSGHASKSPILPDGVVNWKVTGEDSGPVGPVGTGHTGPGGNSTGPGTAPVVDVGTPPPPQPPVEKHVTRVISKGVVTGLAVSLPRPPYPSIAIQAHAHGPVSVQVLIDEYGKVVSAKAISGHPLLLAAAQQAAYRAVFSPTRLGEQAVKVSGVITYNFILP